MLASGFRKPGNFSLASAQILDSNIFCNCRPYLYLFRIPIECTPRRRGHKMMLVLPNRLVSPVLSTLDRCSVSFQPIPCRPRTQTRIILFHGLQRSIPNWELSPNRVPTELSRTAFPITVLPKDDRTDFAQEERLGLPCWTTILAICHGFRIQMSGHSDFGIINNCGASSILT